MNPAAPCRLVAVVFLAGCTSHALLQTAHTTPPGALRVAHGASYVQNEYTSDRHPLLAISGELGVRVGLTEFLDIGAAPFFDRGLSLDAKANLLPHQRALAVAPRLRLGYAAPAESRIWLVETGVLASHRWLGVFEPYAGLAFANHWLDYPMDQPDLAPNQRLAERQGTGNGLLKSHLGLDLTVIGGLGTTLEYGYWKTLNNDPGDGFKFVDNHVLALAIRFQGGHSK